MIFLSVNLLFPKGWQYNLSSHSITEYCELEGAHKDKQVHLQDHLKNHAMIMLQMHMGKNNGREQIGWNFFS